MTPRQTTTPLTTQTMNVPPPLPPSATLRFVVPSTQAFASSALLIRGIPRPSKSTCAIRTRHWTSSPYYVKPCTTTTDSICRQTARRQLSTRMSSSVPSQARKRPIASRIASAALKLLIQSLCTVARDVEVDVNASSNMALLSGRLNGVTVKASSLVYHDVAISGGVALYTDEIILRSSVDTSVLPRLGDLTSAPRLEKPFSVSVRACVTEWDLNRKGPLRDALQVLLTQIVTTGLSGAIGKQLPDSIGGMTCELKHVELIDNDTIPKKRSWFLWSLLFGERQNNELAEGGGCLVLHSTATLSSGRQLSFQVRAGISVSDDDDDENGGNIVKLKDPHLIWNGLAIPMITINMIGVKLDASTKITNVIIDKGRLSADGILVISPPPPMSRRLTSSVR